MPSSVSPIYIPGLFLTASRPFNTVMLEESYESSFFFLVAVFVDLAEAFFADCFGSFFGFASCRRMDVSIEVPKS